MSKIQPLEQNKYHLPSIVVMLLVAVSIILLLMFPPTIWEKSSNNIGTNPEAREIQMRSFTMETDAGPTTILEDLRGNMTCVRTIGENQTPWTCVKL